jgi:hypothetical protein
VGSFFDITYACCVFSVPKAVRHVLTRIPFDDREWPYCCSQYKYLLLERFVRTDDASPACERNFYMVNNMTAARNMCKLAVQISEFFWSAKSW